MKKVLVAAVATAMTLTAGAAFAQHHHHHHGYRGPVIVHRDHWVGPLIGGVVLGAIIADANRPVVVQQQPIVVAQPPVVVQQPSVVVQQPTVVCTEWKETQQLDGTIVRERSCFQR